MQRYDYYKDSEKMLPDLCNLNNRECNTYGAKRNACYLFAFYPDFASPHPVYPS